MREYAADQRSAADQLASLREIVMFMRQTLDRCLAAAHMPPVPAGACALACILLLDAIYRFTPLRPAVRGGAGERQEGIQTPDGRWMGHYWLELTHLDRRWVVDITADQFGWPEVILTDSLQTLSRYRAGDQDEVDEQIGWTMLWLVNEGRAPSGVE